MLCRRFRRIPSKTITEAGGRCVLADVPDETLLHGRGQGAPAVAAHLRRRQRGRGSLHCSRYHERIHDGGVGRPDAHRRLRQEHGDDAALQDPQADPKIHQHGPGRLQGGHGRRLRRRRRVRAGRVLRRAPQPRQHPWLGHCLGGGEIGGIMADKNGGREVKGKHR
ncbi:unnamed protein product [Phaeothamnion confervicola]